MFTSEPSLAQRIERMIGDTPVIDAHSQIPCDQLGADHLAALLDDRLLRAHLFAAGMPEEDGEDDRDRGLPPDERVRRSIPYLKRIRNTSAAWCLYRIFRDLYDFDEPDVTDSNYRTLIDKIAQTANDRGWAQSVLRDKANIRAVVTPLGNKGESRSGDPAFFHYRLEAHDFFGPGKPDDRVRTWANSKTTEEYLWALEARLGERPTTPGRLERLINDWLDRLFANRVRFTSLFLPVDWIPGWSDESSVQAVLDRAGDAQHIPVADAEVLVPFVSRSILRWHHENRKTLQIGVGLEPYLGPESSAARFEPSWAARMAGLFQNVYGGAKFDILTASDVLAHQVAVLAGQLPNVYASGDWWHNFAPTLIEKNFGLRLQVAPMTKIGGFLSDASSVEWTYARLQLARKAMAAALARMVEARFLEEDEIPPLLRQVLHDTPFELFELGEK